MSATLTVERELYFPGDVVRIKVSVKCVREEGVTWLGLQVHGHFVSANNSIAAPVPPEGGSITSPRALLSEITGRTTLVSIMPGPSHGLATIFATKTTTVFSATDTDSPDTVDAVCEVVLPSVLPPSFTGRLGRVLYVATAAVRMAGSTDLVPVSVAFRVAAAEARGVPPCSPMPIAVPWGAKRHDFKLVVIRVKSAVACPLKAVFDGEIPSPSHRHGYAHPSVRAEDGPSSGPSSTRSSASGDDVLSDSTYSDSASSYSSDVSGVVDAVDGGGGGGSGVTGEEWASDGEPDGLDHAGSPVRRSETLPGSPDIEVSWDGRKDLLLHPDPVPLEDQPCRRHVDLRLCMRPLVAEDSGAGERKSFRVVLGGKHVATLQLASTIARPGEAVTGVFMFAEGGPKCLQVCGGLEHHESYALAMAAKKRHRGDPTHSVTEASTVLASFRRLTAHSVLLPFSFVVPLDAPCCCDFFPVQLRWNLRFEFTMLEAAEGKHGGAGGSGPQPASIAVPFQVPLWVVPPARLRPLPGMQYVVLPPAEGEMSPSPADKVGSYPVAQGDAVVGNQLEEGLGAALARLRLRTEALQSADDWRLRRSSARSATPTGSSSRLSPSASAHGWHPVGSPSPPRQSWAPQDVVPPDVDASVGTAVAKFLVAHETLICGPTTGTPPSLPAQPPRLPASVPSVPPLPPPPPPSSAPVPVPVPAPPARSASTPPSLARGAHGALARATPPSPPHTATERARSQTPSPLSAHAGLQRPLPPPAGASGRREGEGESVLGVGRGAGASLSSGWAEPQVTGPWTVDHLRHELAAVQALQAITSKDVALAGVKLAAYDAHIAALEQQVEALCSMTSLLTALAQAQEQPAESDQVPGHAGLTPSDIEEVSLAMQRSIRLVAQLTQAAQQAAAAVDSAASPSLVVGTSTGPAVSSSPGPKQRPAGATSMLSAEELVASLSPQSNSKATQLPSTCPPAAAVQPPHSSSWLRQPRSSSAEPAASSLRAALESPQIRAFRRVRGLPVGPEPSPCPPPRNSGATPTGAPPPFSRRGSAVSASAISTGNWWASVSVGGGGAYGEEVDGMGSVDGDGSSDEGSGSLEGSLCWGGGGGGGGGGGRSVSVTSASRAGTPASFARPLDLLTVSKSGDLGSAMEALQFAADIRYRVREWRQRSRSVASLGEVKGCSAGAHANIGSGPRSSSVGRLGHTRDRATSPGSAAGSTTSHGRRRYVMDRTGRLHLEGLMDSDAASTVSAPLTGKTVPPAPAVPAGGTRGPDLARTSQMLIRGRQQAAMAKHVQRTLGMGAAASAL